MATTRKNARGKVKLGLGISGATGRMGKLIQSTLQDDVALANDFEIVWTASGPQDAYFDLIEKDKPDVLIDFSAPNASLALAKVAAKLRIPLLIGTTGFSPREHKRLGQIIGGKIPWALAPNTSIGIHALSLALQTALQALGSDYSVTIVESHHRAKKDAPSGTAKSLAQILLETRIVQNVPAYSIRGGSEVGEHQVHILGPGERLEFTHRASDRSLFVYGALKLVRILVKLRKRSRAYSPHELFSHK